MIKKLKSTFSQSLNIVGANPTLKMAMLFISFNPPRAGTWSDFWASLAGGIAVVILFPLFRQIFYKDIKLNEIQSLPEVSGFQYAASVFIYAEFMALAMTFGVGLANIYHPRPIDWAAFVGLTVLKSLVLAIPLGIWGWYEHHRLRNIIV